MSILFLQNNKFNGEGSSARNSSARKNCSTPKSRLLDTVRADAKKNETARKSPKKSFRADAFLDQNDQLLELHLLDKRLKNCQLLDNIFSKEMVYRYGR